MDPEVCDFTEVIPIYPSYNVRFTGVLQAIAKNMYYGIHILR